MLTFDDWKCTTPPEYEDGDDACRACAGNGFVLVLVREWHSESHGFDGEDSERDCVVCSGSGRR